MNDNIDIEIEVSQEDSNVVGVEVESDIIKVYPELEDLVVKPTSEEQHLKSEKYGFNEITVRAIETEDITITPTTEEQHFTSEKDGYKTVIVNPISNEELEKEIEELEAEIISLKRKLEEEQDFTETEIGNPVVLTDSTDLNCEIYLFGNTQQNGEPTPTNKVEIVTVGSSGSVKITVGNGLEPTDENYQSYTKILPVQKEFCKIGDNQDCFVKEKGVWYEQHGYNIKTLTGSEFAYAGETKNFFVAQNAMNDNSLTSDYGYCDYFQVRPDWNNLGGWLGLPNNGMVVGRTSSHQIIIRCDEYEGARSSFRSMINSKSPKVYYQLETLEKIECTTEQVEILNGFTTYRNKTNISVEGIGTLKVLYKKER